MNFDFNCHGNIKTKSKQWMQQTLISYSIMSKAYKHPKNV